MTLMTAFAALATLLALYVAWCFVRELRTRSGWLGTLDSLLMALWAATAAFLAWASDDLPPWIPRATVVLGVVAVAVGLFAMLQLVRAEKAKKNTPA